MKLSQRLTLSLGLVSLAAISLLLQAEPALAQTGLQVNPLKYEDKLKTDKVHSGFIDVANPGDSEVHIQASVQGFRQADLDGNLAFFDSASLRSAIKPGLSEFDIGPRESIRVSFTVEPTKLPKGGVYAVIFFRTVAPAATSTSNSIFESANIGTLLILQNGEDLPNLGQIHRARLPWVQLGSGITGDIEYKNLSPEANGSAFYPSLVSKIYPWGKASTIKGPFIMPGSTRRFSFEKTGAYIGIIPVIISDANTRSVKTTWVLAVTGWYRWLCPMVIVLIMAVAPWWLRRHRRQTTKPVRVAVKPLD